MNAKLKKKAKPRAASKWPATLFPLPRNRKRTPTDAETLLHALAIGIRDHATHTELRQLIGFLPRIRNRVSPYTATAKENFELQERVGALEQELQKLRRRKPALTAEGEQTMGGASGSFVMDGSLTPEAREALTKVIHEWVNERRRAGGVLAT